MRKMRVDLINIRCEFILHSRRVARVRRRKRLQIPEGLSTVALYALSPSRESQLCKQDKKKHEVRKTRKREFAGISMNILVIYISLFSFSFERGRARVSEERLPPTHEGDGRSSGGSLLDSGVDFAIAVSANSEGAFFIPSDRLDGRTPYR